MRKLHWRTIVLVWMLLGALTVKAETLTVTGTVVSASDNEPLIGASVVVKGSSASTITDVNGSFTLANVERGAVLTASYIGYKSKDVKATSAKLTIALEEDADVLEDVVVVGYGVLKKKLVTGATSQVKGDDIQKMNTTNPLSAMQGQTPGVNIVSTSGQPGAAMSVTIPWSWYCGQLTTSIYNRWCGW